MEFSKVRLLAVITVGLAAQASVVVAQNTPITKFTPGDLVVMRGGDATHSENDYATGEVPMYLDEYTPTGSYVGTYAIPTDVMTLPGIGLASHEGHLNISGNGQYIDFAGYQQPVDPNTARVTDGSGMGPYYQIGQVSTSGVFSHTALNATVASPQYLRAAYSNDGSEMWVASKYNGPPGQGFGGGLEYVANFGTSGATTTALQGNTDWRNVQIAGGQLYGGTGSSSVGTHGFYAIGAGAPTSPTPTNTLLTPLSDNSTTAFGFVTLPGTQPINGVAGTPNVAYVVGDPSGNAYIGKLYSAGGTPLSANNLTYASRESINALGSPEGLSVQIDPTNSKWVDIFVQTSTGVYEAIDKSGSSNGDFGTLTFNQIVSSTSDTYFYGLTMIPAAAPQALTGDVNHDGIVNGQDLALVSSNWLQTGSMVTGDVNNDGIVNGQDLALVSSNWLATSGAGAAVAPVPEPGSIALAVLAMLCGGYPLVRRHAK
ncbi:MAG TPA: dockerin type I domain-containing protein [Pirellulales bacterium]|jgi:hypothetical protein